VNTTPEMLPANSMLPSVLSGFASRSRLRRSGERRSPPMTIRT
jgi:hypothetical protein